MGIKREGRDVEIIFYIYALSSCISTMFILLRTAVVLIKECREHLLVQRLQRLVQLWWWERHEERKEDRKWQETEKRKGQLRWVREEWESRQKEIRQWHRSVMLVSFIFFPTVICSTLSLNWKILWNPDMPKLTEWSWLNTRHKTRGLKRKKIKQAERDKHIGMPCAFFCFFCLLGTYLSEVGRES